MRNELFGELRTFLGGDHPTNDIATENIENNVEVEIGPFGRTLKFSDVPRPKLIGAGGYQLRFLVVGSDTLIAAFSKLTLGLENAVHGADRTEVTTLIQ